jgi:hypothetical protein
MDLIIHYCDVCTRRISQAELESGNDTATEDRRVCVACKKAGASVAKPVALAESAGVASTSSAVMPGRRGQHATARGHAHGHPADSDKNPALIWGGAAAILLLGLFVFSGKSIHTTPKGPVASNKTPVTTPVMPDPISVTPTNNLNTIITPVLPALPTPEQASDKEAVAGKALDAIFNGIPADDKDTRIAKLKEFTEKYGDTLYGARARTLQSRLQTETSAEPRGVVPSPTTELVPPTVQGPKDSKPSMNSDDADSDVQPEVKARSSKPEAPPPEPTKTVELVIAKPENAIVEKPIALTVNGGTGGGMYTAGNIVKIRAGPAPAGKMFDKWAVDSGAPVLADVKSVSTTLTVPGIAASVTAKYKALPIRGPGGVISISFTDIKVAGATLQPAEFAGVLPRCNWNNYPYNSSQYGLNPKDDAGRILPKTFVNYRVNAQYSGSFTYTPANPNDRLMKYYCGNDELQDNTRTLIRVNGLPESFVAAGYSIYVYSDWNNAPGDTHTIDVGASNLSATNTTDTIVVSSSINFKDTKDWKARSGTFTQGTGGDANGNYVVFANQTASEFTLRPNAGGGGGRIAINGIQIVVNDATSQEGKAP